MIGIRQEVARRIESFLRDLKPAIRELWIESALQKSGRLRFSSPLPGAVYTKVFEGFVDALCDSLGEDDLGRAESFWPEAARSGRLTGHTHDEVVHLCTTACRSLTEAIDGATEGADDGLSVRIALQRLLAEVKDTLALAEKPPAADPPPPPPPTVAADLDALVAAAESVREGLAWSELCERDVRRSRRLEALRLMLVEIRGLSPAKATESVLRRLHDELPCRICLLVRHMGARLRLEGQWPAGGLGRELGEEIQLDEQALDRFPKGVRGAALPVEHAVNELDAELAAIGARGMFVVSLPRGKEPAGWLIVGTEDEGTLAPDDVEFAETVAALLGTVLDNASLSVQLSSAVGRLRDLVRAAPEPIFLLDPAGLVLDMSEAAAQVFGVPCSALVRTTLCEKNVLGGRDELKAFLASATADSGAVPRLLTGRRDDGTTFLAACSVAALEDGTLILALRNVTNVVRAAEVHRDARARYRALLDSAADVVFLLDLDGRCVDAGERGLATYGVKREQVLKRTPANVLDEVTAAHLLENLRHVLEFGTPTTGETTLVARGDELTFQTTLSPVVDAEGATIAVLGIARDVSAARQLEQELRRVSTLSNSVVRHAPIGIGVLDASGCLASANDALAHIVRPGSTADDITGLNLIAGGDAPLAALAEQFRAALNGTPFTAPRLEHTTQSGAGETWLAVRGTRLPDEAAGQARVLVLVEDVTEQVRLQDELVESEKVAAAGALVASLARELTSGLAPVIGHAQMLQHRKIGIGEMAHVNAIERCAQRARRVVESLLAFSKPTAPSARTCDVNAVIREACALVERQCTARGIKLLLDLDARVPSTLADEGQLAHVLLNLLNNAHQAMYESGGTVTIATSSSASAITVTVSDTGGGIAPEDLDRIFEPFYTTKKAGSGAGLGLTVARAIVRSHGGSICAESGPGSGATFHIELPLRTPPPGDAAERRPRPRGPARPLRILLVDHDEEMLAMTRKLLVGAGHRVAACATAHAALEGLRASSLDVVVADLGMPELGGLDLHARLTAERPELAAHMVLTTAEACDASTRESLRAAGCRLVTKPFDVRELLAAIAEVAPGSSTQP